MPSLPNECLTPECRERSAHKGLCMKCYSEAKNLVEAKTATWEALAALGLAEHGESKFAKALKQKLKEEKQCHR